MLWLYFVFLKVLLVTGPSYDTYSERYHKQPTLDFCLEVHLISCPVAPQEVPLLCLRLVFRLCRQPGETLRSRLNRLEDHGNAVSDTETEVHDVWGYHVLPVHVTSPSSHCHWSISTLAMLPSSVTQFGNNVDDTSFLTEADSLTQLNGNGRQLCGFYIDSYT